MITVIYLYALYIKKINRAIYSITFSLHENPSRINGDSSLHSFFGLFLLIFFLSLFRSMLISEIYMTNTHAASQPKMFRARWSARSTISTTATPSRLPVDLLCLLLSAISPDRIDLFFWRDPHVERVSIVSAAFRARRADRQSVIDSDDLDL